MLAMLYYAYFVNKVDSELILIYSSLSTDVKCEAVRDK
jgi:hypothetical protein